MTKYKILAAFCKMHTLRLPLHSIICTIVHHFNERKLNNYTRGGRMKNESSCRLGMHAALEWARKK